MKKFILLAAIIPLLFGSCGVYYAYPVFEINKVSENKRPQSVKGGVFKNERISASLLCNLNSVTIDIENKTDETLFLSWNESVLVDIKGYSSRIIPGSTRKIDAEKSIVPTPISPYSKMQEESYCSDERRFFHVSGKKRSVLNHCQERIGNSMGLNILLRSETGDSYRYIFDLKIEDIILVNEKTGAKESIVNNKKRR
jgi:hypothetical protein